MLRLFPEVLSEVLVEMSVTLGLGDVKTIIPLRNVTSLEPHVAKAFPGLFAHRFWPSLFKLRLVYRLGSILLWHTHEASVSHLVLHGGSIW